MAVTLAYAEHVSDAQLAHADGLVLREMQEMRVGGGVNSRNNSASGGTSETDAVRARHGLLDSAGEDAEMASSEEYVPIEQRGAGVGLDRTRLTLPSPDGEDVEEWSAAIANSRAVLEHQHLRLQNTLLALTAPARQQDEADIERLKALERDVAEELRAERREVELVNAQRQRHHLQAGESIQALWHKWKAIEDRNALLEQECSRLGDSSS